MLSCSMLADAYLDTNSMLLSTLWHHHDRAVSLERSLERNEHQTHPSQPKICILRYVSELEKLFPPKDGKIKDRY
jgi:hypothetical protein